MTVVKKLHVNIEDIKIKGRPEVLTKPVDDIDRRMQALAQATESIKGTMYRFSGTNRGKQYEKACDAVSKLSTELYNASEALNELQHQIIKFENKVHRYENEPPSRTKPRPHNVKKVKIIVRTAEVEFHYPQMITVRDALGKYCISAREECKKLSSNRDAIGAVWMDRQFKDFSAYIDDVRSIIVKGCAELDDYKRCLDRTIRELQQEGD